MSYGCIDRLTTIGEMWLELFDECLQLGGVCTRIDMPVDDFTGNIRIDEIKTKVERKEYTTRMKKIEEASSYIDKDQYASSHCESNQGLNDYVSTINSKNKGYSITFGNRR